MFKKTNIMPFEKKVWLATPTMHGEELKYVTEAYETNWGTKDNRDKNLRKNGSIMVLESCYLCMSQKL